MHLELKPKIMLQVYKKGSKNERGNYKLLQ